MRWFEHDKDKIKLYKTHRGWMTSLTRIFRLIFRNHDDEHNKRSIEDKDALNDDDTGIDSFAAGLTAITAVLGGGIGLNTAYTHNVHAAKKLADNHGSAVVGSTSSSNSLTTTTNSTDLNSSQQRQQNVSNNNVVTVANEKGLATELKNTNVSVINISRNVTLSHSLNLAPRNITVNANGHTLNFANSHITINS